MVQIDETLFPVELAWQGRLADVDDQRGPQELPEVSIGKPVWWSDREILGANWLSPNGGNHYGLARFSFSLRPQERQSVNHAELTIYLHAKGVGSHPVFFDIWPRYVAEDTTIERTIGIGPDLKFGEVVISVGKIESKISIRQATSVIAADGIGESRARWNFHDHPAHPLTSSQIVFAIVELQPEVSAARVNLQLNVEIATHFGPIRGLLPKSATENLSWILE